MTRITTHEIRTYKLYVVCTNCNAKKYMDIPFKKLAEDCDCINCGCKTLIKQKYND